MLVQEMFLMSCDLGFFLSCELGPTLLLQTYIGMKFTEMPTSDDPEQNQINMKALVASYVVKNVNNF